MMKKWTQKAFVWTTILTGLLFFLSGQVKAQNVFVADFLANKIYEYTPGSGQSIFATLSRPFGLAFDKSGNLYVSQFIQIGTVYKYTPDGTQSVYATGLTYPTGLAFDSAGDLFVGNVGNGNITEISTNGTQTSFASGLTYPYGLTFDAAGDLFVVNLNSQNIVEFPTNGGQSIIASNVGAPVASTMNTAGVLYVGNSASNNIPEYMADGSLAGFLSVTNPWGLAFDCASNLFVAEGTVGSIVEITPSGSQSVLASGLPDPIGVAIQPVPRLTGTAGNGNFQVSVSLPSPYFSTIVQTSTDLFNWAGISTNIPPYTLTNSITGSPPVLFYRALIGP